MEEEKNISKEDVSGKEKGKMVNLKAEEDGGMRLRSCDGARVSSVFNLFVVFWVFFFFVCFVRVGEREGGGVWKIKKQNIKNEKTV
jgi:hypothetical protein